ncbi:MAG: DUF192 domain-containing protein [Nitrospinae bacterium]|nr:DUF192 domain-containing protein [Nitrospinota bacterium]
MRINVHGQIYRIKDCRGLSSLRGLMCDPLEDYQGALIYSNSIWMLFVKHALDLIFLDEHYRVVQTGRGVPLTWNPRTWRVYRCPQARYCLELKAGLVKVEQGATIAIMAPSLEG